MKKGSTNPFNKNAFQQDAYCPPVHIPRMLGGGGRSMTSPSWGGGGWVSCPGGEVVVLSRGWCPPPPVTMWPIPWSIWCRLPPPPPSVTMRPIPWYIGCHLPPPELNRISDTSLWKHNHRSLRYTGGKNYRIYFNIVWIIVETGIR